MRLRTLIAIVVTMCALPVIAAELPTAPAPRAVSKVRAYKLKSASAQIVAGAVAKHLEGKQLEGRVTFDVANNCVFVCAEPDILRQTSDVVAALDTERGKSSMYVYSLKHIAAADAAHAVGALLKARELDAAVVAEPVSNTVLLSAEPALQKQLIDILTALDKQPPQVTVQVTVMKVAKDFVEQSGLNVGAALGATSWILSARELQMFTGLIRAAKERGECEVLSRPTICVTDNQTGTVQIVQEPPIEQLGAKPVLVTTVFTFRATPRVKPDGGMSLRAEVQITEKGKIVVGTATKPGSKFPMPQFVQVANAQSVQTTTELKTGETIVTQVGETLVIVTPTVIQK